MKKSTAIKVLEAQKAKLLDSEYFKDETWVFQTGSYISNFFGTDSVEYSYISQLKFWVVDDGKMTPERFKREMNAIYRKTARFLDNCIETINDKGLLKEVRPNFLYRLSDAWLTTIFAISVSGLLSIGFAFGQFVTDTKNYKLEEENKKLKLLLSKSQNTMVNNNRDTATHKVAGRAKVAN